MSSYVMQDDLLAANLTVAETLYYASNLRLARTTTFDERAQRVNEVLKLMGIEYCQDVIIGDSRNKGISGGERKRVCVAMELLSKPKLLFLDEPTSGLDSTTALSLMETLKGLADSGECTVVCTIHQPQTKIFSLLDNLLLMKKGEIVYQGKAAQADSFFTAQGFPCPEKMNPADHLLDLVTIGVNDESKSSFNVKRLSVPIDIDFGKYIDILSNRIGCRLQINLLCAHAGLDKSDFTPRAFQWWWFQFAILVQRNFIERIRRWDIILMNVFVTCIVGTFIGMGAWHHLGSDKNRMFDASTIPKFNPVLFFCVIHQGVISSLQGTYAFPIERALMLRERQAGSYYVSAYFLSKSVVDMFIQSWMPIIFTG